jgi:hypothetical protein
MGFGLHGANQTYWQAHSEQIHIGCHGLWNKMVGGKNTTNEHNCSHNHTHFLIHPHPIWLSIDIMEEGVHFISDVIKHLTNTSS